MFRYSDRTKRNCEPCIKVCLLRNGNISFRQVPDGEGEGCGKKGEVRVTHSITAFDDTEPARKFRDRLKQLLEEQFGNGSRSADGRNEEKQLQIIFASATPFGFDFGSCRKFRIELKGQILDQLKILFGNDQLRVKVELMNMSARRQSQTAFSFAQPFIRSQLLDRCGNNGHGQAQVPVPNSIFSSVTVSSSGAVSTTTSSTPGFGFNPPSLGSSSVSCETQEMKVALKVLKQSLPNVGRAEIICEDNEVDFPPDWASAWSNNDDYLFSANLNIIVSVSQTVIAPVVPDVLMMNKKLLQDEVECNAEVVASNGAQIKCHRSFLAVHSTVLATMFQSSFQESKTSRIEMVDMSEDGVKALLAFLYFWDIEQPMKNPCIALELLEAGHKYDIPTLENHMRKILLEKPNLWYEVDVAVRLFLFSRNVDGFGDVVIKAVQVLKSKSSEELHASTEYRKLFQAKPEAATDLCTRALTTINLFNLAS